MEIDEIQTILKKVSARFNLVEEAKKGCHSVILQLVQKGDNIAGLEPSELIYEFNCQTLVFNSYRSEIPFIRTEIGIYIKDLDNVWARGLEPVGKYELDTNLEGEHIDDWLHFEKQVPGKRLA